MRRREFIAGRRLGHVCYTGPHVPSNLVGIVAPFALLEVELNIGANPILRWNMLDADSQVPRRRAEDVSASRVRYETIDKGSTDALVVLVQVQGNLLEDIERSRIPRGYVRLALPARPA